PPATERYRKNRSSMVDFDRRRSIEGEKRKKKKRRREKYLLTRTPLPPTDCPHAVVALARRRFFSRARTRNVSLRGEKDQGDVTPFGMHYAYHPVSVPYWYRDNLDTPQMETLADQPSKRGDGY
ncbi:hypothetical protein GW17_00042310, partial [Ensete ventricosum]